MSLTNLLMGRSRISCKLVSESECCAPVLATSPAAETKALLCDGTCFNAHKTWFRLRTTFCTKSSEAQCSRSVSCVTLLLNSRREISNATGSFAIRCTSRERLTGV